MNIVIIFLLIFEIIITGIFLYFSIKRKLFLDKKNLFYFIPVLILNTLIYAIGIYYNKNSLMIFDFFTAFSKGLETFAFKISFDYIKALYEVNVLFKIVSIYGFSIAAICTFSTALGLIKIFLFNEIRIRRIYNKEHVDVVIGYTPDSLKYLNNYKNAFLIIDLNEKKLSYNEKKELFVKGVAFKNIKLEYSNLNKYFNRIKYNINVIYFSNSNNYGSILNLIENTKIKDEKKIISYRVQTDSKFQQFLNDQLSIKARVNKNVMASSFDIHELISLEFSKKHNLAEFISNDHFYKGALKEDVNINCYFLGFGKTNRALFKTILINNQFVKNYKDRVDSYQVNYHIYDKDKLNISYLQFINAYDKCFKYFDNEIPDKPCNLKANQKNLLGDGITDLMDSLDTSKSTYNFFFVSLENSFDNNAIANQLFYHVGGNKVIFYKVRNQTEIIFDNDKLIPFGFKANIVNHHNICCEEEYSFASKTNDLYQQIKDDSMIEFRNLNIVEKLSNIYQDLNLRFKLNCLGLDISNEKDKSLSKKEFEEIIEINKLKSYSDYFNDLTINNLIKQEHARWNTYYLFSGFIPLCLKDVYFKEGKVIHKDLVSKKHACITTFKGLDILHKHELELYKQNKVNKTIDDIETYKYDIQLLTGLLSHLEAYNYCLVKKEDKVYD